MKLYLLLLITALVQITAAKPPVDWNSETIHCGNLVYGKNQTSVCFADTFLTEAKNATGLNIHPKFARIQLKQDEVFQTPLCIFTGEGDFSLNQTERGNLRKYLENGGFTLASPGCSDSKWNASFKRELALSLPNYQLQKIPMDHDLFSMVHKIRSVVVKGKNTSLYGLFINGRLALVYSPEGLNNAKNAKGCCCCGGAEITDAKKINVNAVAYALLH